MRCQPIPVLYAISTGFTVYRSGSSDEQTLLFYTNHCLLVAGDFIL
ncbi:hypothetical protein AB0756_00635 [Tolypothrix campylonemoides VB511288_2]|uniref:Uncharacterized protein n=3 Tax=Nostocales TaxID=1161 RepID=A0A8S9TD98_9CYAN|nr:hypothetical protein DA73_0400037330 [Tolypothrix bouteillei VB521301]